MSICIEPSTAETHTGGWDTTDINEHFPVSLQLIPRAPLLHLVAGMEIQDAAGVELAAASTLASPPATADVARQRGGEVLPRLS